MTNDEVEMSRNDGGMVDGGVPTTFCARGTLNIETLRLQI